MMERERDFIVILAFQISHILLLSPDYVLTLIRYTSLSEAYGSRYLNKGCFR